jgi:hypothetical protein
MPTKRKASQVTQSDEQADQDNDEHDQEAREEFSNHVDSLP